ncbi:MAG: phosphonate ABC transporter ATP-binding protein [Acidimicrobiia bacterium]
MSVSGLRKTYGDHAALDGVDLRVGTGEVVALVGPNGAGKSTLLRCLVRLVEPTAGEVHLDGREVTGAGRGELRRIRAGVGFVFQRFHLVPRLSAFHNVIHGAMGREGVRAWWPLLSRAEVRDEAVACLGRVGLAAQATRRVDTLSGGQAQRVAVARMLMQRPRVILADEPVASLDPAAATGLMELLRSVAAESHLTVVSALHQLDYARRYTDRVVGLRGGSVCLDEPAAGCGAAHLEALYAGSASR